MMPFRGFLLAAQAYLLLAPPKLNPLFGLAV
jgi:hypothetical protein